MYGNYGKRSDYGGNGREWRGMVRTTQGIIGIPSNICLTMGSSPHHCGKVAEDLGKTWGKVPSQ